MEISTKETSKMKLNAKLKRYYSNDFITDYPKEVVRLPLGRTIQNTLVYDNWINKTVNRYAAASVGKYATIEVDNEELQILLEQWHEDIDFSNKLTTIARYQGLFGYAVVKIIFNYPRDEAGSFIVDKNKGFIDGVNLAVFGADTSFFRLDEYGNVESILIQMGDRLEVFFKDRVEVYILKGHTYVLADSYPNPVETPLAFVVLNTDTGGEPLSDVSGIITLQEQLNDALTSSRLNSYYHGFPIYTATGVAPEFYKDADGNETDTQKPLNIGAGMTLQSESTDARFGRLEAASSSDSIAIVESITKEIAVATNSLSLLTGAIPSGTALAYLLTDFNSLVTEKQSKLKAFISRFHRTIFHLLDYATGSSYRDVRPKVYVSGNNAVQRDYDFNQAKEARSMGEISRRTFLDNLEIIESTEIELERLTEEAQASGSPLLEV